MTNKIQNNRFSPVVKFLPVTDWEVLTLDWVYKLWKILKEQRENGVEASIKTWSLNNKMIVTEDQEYARVLEAWHKKNLWYGVDYEMTEAAISYHNTILNSYLIGFDEKCPEYFEMIDAYMKGTFFDFFYTQEFAYWIRNEDPEEPYYEKDTLYFKRQGKYGIVTSEHYQLSMGGTIEALEEWHRVKDKEIYLIRYRPIQNTADFPPVKNFIENSRH